MTEIEINIPLNEKGVRKAKGQLIREVVENLGKQSLLDDTPFRLVKYRKSKEEITLKYETLKRKIL